MPTRSNYCNWSCRTKRKRINNSCIETMSN